MATTKRLEYKSDELRVQMWILLGKCSTQGSEKKLEITVMCRADNCHGFINFYTDPQTHTFCAGSGQKPCTLFLVMVLSRWQNLTGGKEGYGKSFVLLHE